MSTVESQARCRHYGECGGCQAQDVAYARQLVAKQAQLAELFGAFWEDSIPVTPSPVIWNYRNKIDPSFALRRYDTPPPKDFPRETVLGFKKPGRWYWPLKISECQIGPEGLGPLLAGVKRWVAESGLRAFDSRAKEGFLRNLLVRDAKRTGERMVVLITCPGAFDAAPFVRMVSETFGAVSIWRGISERGADVAIADELELLHGEPSINETLHIPDGGAALELNFRISPMSFFQTNPCATEALYGAIRAWVRDHAPAHLYDLYGGMGGIAFSCAGLVGHVWSVEEVEAASIDGRENAERNGIGNVTFITEKVEKYLQYQLEAEGLAEGAAVVLDPARGGMHPKAIKRLITLAPERVLYVSCNPKLLARELPEFLEQYRLAAVQAFDLFPHTKHVEVLAALERK